MVSGRKVTTNYVDMGFVLVEVRKGKLIKRLPKCLNCEKVFTSTCKIRLRGHNETCNSKSLNGDFQRQRSDSRNENSRGATIDKETIHKLRKNMKQSNLDNFIENLTMSDDDIRDTKIALAEFFYANNISFRTVENIYFKKFIHILRPEFLKYLPNRKHLAGDLVDTVHQKCIEMDKKNIRKDSVLLVDGWTHGVTQTEWTTSLIHNADGSTAFVNAEELDTKDAIGLSQAVGNASDISHQLYNTSVYAFETDNAAAYVSAGRNMSHTFWHFRCNSHTANLLVFDLIDQTLETKINTVQVFFKYNFRNDQKLRKTAKVILPSRTRWCYHLTSYKNLLSNLSDYRSIDAERFGRIKDKTKKEKLTAVHNILFEIDFVNKVKEQIKLIEPICRLILNSQKKKYSLGEFIKEWISLPTKYENFESNNLLRDAVNSRSEFVLNDKSLSAYAFLPSTDFNSLDIMSKCMVDSFILRYFKSNTKAIEDFNNFKKKKGFFAGLSIDLSPFTYWEMAQSSCPGLADLAIKLINIPGSSAEIERLFGDWSRLHSAIRNRLSPDMSKKLVHINYSLRKNMVLETQSRQKRNETISVEDENSEIILEETSFESSNESVSESDSQSNGYTSDQSEAENNRLQDSFEECAATFFEALRYEESEDVDAIEDCTFEVINVEDC